MFVEKMIECIEENYEIDEPEKELDEDIYNAIDLKFYLIFRTIADAIQDDCSGSISVGDLSIL
ncbi:hypothetical protein DRN98_08270 [Methanosarcinales archaeon]|nr:MAG: hypothetical protein DRN98_08270 [Methanosarcinales archaeon]